MRVKMKSLQEEIISKIINNNLTLRLWQSA